jgi:hypothetical protein
MPSFSVLPGSEGFFVFRLRAGLSIVNLTSENVRRVKLKDQHMNKVLFVSLALAGVFIVSKSAAVSFNDVQFWIGSGTNRAALVIEWSAPEDFGGSTVPAPIADKTLVWGYRFNGMATGTQMLKAILGADKRFYVVADLSWGSTYVEGIGYNLAGGGAIGITDGSSTNFFTNNFLTTITVTIDASATLNQADLYWAGVSGPNWEVWTELGDSGGFLSCPERGTNAFWTPDDPASPWSGTHGQWELAQQGLDALQLTNGSWIGFSVAAGELDYYNTPVSAPYYVHKHAPAQPDPGITALVKNFIGGFQTGQWQAQFMTCTNWLYTLQRTVDFQSWTNVSTATTGNGTNLSLLDANPPTGRAFYRVHADRP